ncbi:hypothetical protein MUDAN_DOGOELCO_03414 [Lactiplantibacillus mudanjiangensis]|nr:hypothetical protein MUDAN_DOGOELCO_03414 [Lactiplantibacillus mudanjiangensis]
MEGELRPERQPANNRTDNEDDQRGGAVTDVERFEVLAAGRAGGRDRQITVEQRTLPASGAAAQQARLQRAGRRHPYPAMFGPAPQT